MKDYIMIILNGNPQLQNSGFIMRLNFLEEKDKSKILYTLVHYLKQDGVF